MNPNRFRKWKRLIRLIEARLTPQSRTVQFRGHSITLTKSVWWDETTQTWFDAEIESYFRIMRAGPKSTLIVDAGASSGIFSLAAARYFPRAHIHAFEPSPRNQILARRNIRRNHVTERVHLYPVGLWNCAGEFAFHSHGAMSSFEKVSAAQGVSFDEPAKVVTLDSWAEKIGCEKLDVIKMDIEGAEIEALQGAQETIRHFRPEILLQAYHIREGKRTYERCREILSSLGYTCREAGPEPGFLHGTI